MQEQGSRVTYTATRLFLADIVPVTLLLVIPVFAHAGVFSSIADFFDPKAEAHAPLAEKADELPILRAAINLDPNPAKGGGDILVESGALVPDTGPLGGSDSSRHSESTGEISVYIVREGDTLSKVAEMFNVTTNTILWANNIGKASAIQPGDELIILPITGVRHVVKKGDSIKSIADKYSGNIDDILAYNQLESGDELKPGVTIVIPGGEVEIAKEVPSKKTTSAPAKGTAAAGSIRGYFTHPVPGAVRTQGIHGYNGVDLAAPVGTPVRAAAAGEVIISKSEGWNGGYGQYIVVKHANGTQTLYAHLSANKVAPGAKVAQGQLIGSVGNTGRSTGNHLHFEVRGAKNPF